MGKCWNEFYSEFSSKQKEFQSWNFSFYFSSILPSLEETSSSQIFETNQVTQCQKVTALWQKRAQDTPAQVMAQRPKRANWCTHCGSFQPWEGSWNSAIAQGKACSASSVPLVWHPHQHTVLRQDKSVLRAGHRVVALQSLTSHRPKLHDKGSVLRKDGKGTLTLVLHLLRWKFYCFHHSFFLHQPRISRFYYSRVTLPNNQQ